MSKFSPVETGMSKADKIYQEVDQHYTQWNEDNDNRRIRKNGWNDVTDAYWGKLPADWPYLNKVVDPRIRTSLIEKNARLLNTKLRGRLVPREGGDVLKARINNALLDFQWDNANYGGTMLDKWGQMDLDTRLYGSKFALVYWKHEQEREDADEDDQDVLFDGNEMKPLDIRDCGMDPTADHIRNARWFQVREWKDIGDIEQENGTDSSPKFTGLAELKAKIADNKSDRRDTVYENRILTLKGLPDRMGDDKSFNIVEVVTEYRPDRVITFAPQYKVLLRNIKNPYNHHKIPVIQLRYYSIQGDPIGESEVEPVLPIWKAIQATVCGYLDNMANHIRPPLKIIEGAARIETIFYGPDAQWLVDRQDAVMEMTSNGEAMRNFQTTYQALTSAFNTAMGDTSLGVSAVDPTSNRRTATEIKNSERQQNNRDQKNQGSLADCIQDMMSMWLVNNRQFLFLDDSKKEYILRILGSDLFEYFKRAGLDEMVLSDEATKTIGEIIMAQGGNVSDADIMGMVDAGKVPKFPIIENPKEKNPDKMIAKPKMRTNDMGDGAEISLVPEDLDGNYDYIASVKSMAIGAEKDLMQGRQAAIEMITSNPMVQQMLAAEGVKPLIKELLISSFEDSGLKDADRFFSKAEAPQQPPQQASMPGMEAQGMPGQAPSAQQGVPGMPQAPSMPPQVPQQGLQQPM